MSKIMNEYDSLRSELIAFEEQQRNVWIYMYVLFITLFVLGIEFSNNLFLITYVVLIPFQVVINRYKWYIFKLSAFIRVFYEKESEKLNWETLSVSTKYKEFYNKYNKGISGKIRYTSVSQLGLLSTAFYILKLLYYRFDSDIYAFNLNFGDILFIILSIILFIIVVILNGEYNKDYSEELETVIQEYKNDLIK